MSAMGGALHAEPSRLVVVTPAPERQAADATAAVRRLRYAAARDAAWHELLDGVYAHAGFLNP